MRPHDVFRHPALNKKNGNTGLQNMVQCGASCVRECSPAVSTNYTELLPVRPPISASHEAGPRHSHFGLRWARSAMRRDATRPRALHMMIRGCGRRRRLLGAGLALLCVVALWRVFAHHPAPTPTPRALRPRWRGPVDKFRAPEPEEPVDVVYRWVNGSDPGWLAQFERAQRMHAVRNNATADGNSVTKARFFDNEELRYSLRSLFANGEGLGIGMVWIVTSQQVRARAARTCGALPSRPSGRCPRGFVPTPVCALFRVR